MSFISKIFGKVSTRSASMSGVQRAYGICDAARDGDESAVKELLGKGADINSTGGGTIDYSPLMWAAGNGNIGIMRLLLERGADPNLRNGRGVTALLPAAQDGRLDAVRLLLDRGANVHSEVKGVSPLSAAAAFGHLEVVRMLLERGARDNNGRAFSGASQLGHQGIMDLLKQRGR